MADTTSSQPTFSLATQVSAAMNRPEPPPPTVPGYQILEELGRGGMGVVYKARQTALNRLVALKMILADSDVDVRIRFLGEAEAVAAIEHPNVVQIHEFGETEGQPFLVMEYVGGGCLAQLLKETKRLPPRSAAALVAKVARGVQAVHEAGIIHRDLKPANILLGTPDGVLMKEDPDPEAETLTSPLSIHPAALRPKVSDFGIAKRSKSFDLTQTGMALGTPAYMAPEQATGEGKFLGPTADVHALGVILFECLTGQIPYQADTPEKVMYRVVQSDPPSLRGLAPSAPRELDLICLKCLAKKPHERYQSAQAMAEDLDRFLAGEPISIVSPGPIEKAARWIRKYPTRAAAYALGMLAITFAAFTVMALSLWAEADTQRGKAVIARDEAQQAQRLADEQRGKAELARADADTQRGKAEKARADADHVSAVRAVDLAFREYEQDNPARAKQLLASCPPKFRAWEWHVVNRLVSQQTQTLSAPGLRLSSLALSPKGDWVAVAGMHAAGPGMMIWDLPSGTLKVNLPDSVRYVTTNRDGLLATVSSNSDITIYDQQMGGTRLAQLANLNNMEFHPGGKLLVGVTGSHALIIDPANPKFRVECAWGKGSVNLARCSPNGDRIAVGGQAETVTVIPSGKQVPTNAAAVRIYDGRTGQLLTESLKLAVGDIHGLAWSRDGKMVAIGASLGTVSLIDAANGLVMRRFTAGKGVIESVAFSSDGSLLAAASSDRLVRVWEVATGQTIDVLRGHTLAVNVVAFRPDGLLVSAGDDGTVRLWRVSMRPPEVSTHVSLGLPRRVACTSDGKHLMLASGLFVHVWDVRGAKLAAATQIATDVHSLALSPDGTTITIIGADGVAFAWNWQTNARPALPRGPELPVSSTTPDAKLVVTRTADQLAVVDRLSGNVITTVASGHRGDQMATAINHDGSRVASGGTDGTVRLYDGKTGAELWLMAGHTTSVKALAFNPDGTRLASVSWEGWIKVWDVRTGFEVLTLRMPQHHLSAVGWSPDGTKLIAGGEVIARILDATPWPEK